MLQKFNDVLFLIDLGDSLGQLYTISSDVNDFFSAWNKVFLTILDKHAPIKAKRIKRDTKPGWFSDIIKEAIKKRDAYHSKKDWNI